MNELEKHIDDSIKLIQQYQPLADQLGGYKVAFSGGKDSQVMYDLFKKANVPFTAVYSVTTNDPPENVRFIRKEYPDVIFKHPKRTFLQIVEQKGLPQMNMRFCCSELKEASTNGVTAVGVRREESRKRATYDTIAFKGGGEVRYKQSETKIKYNITTDIRVERVGDLAVYRRQQYSYQSLLRLYRQSWLFILSVCD